MLAYTHTHTIMSLFLASHLHTTVLKPILHQGIDFLINNCIHTYSPKSTGTTMTSKCCHKNNHLWHMWSLQQNTVYDYRTLHLNHSCCCFFFTVSSYLWQHLLWQDSLNLTNKARITVSIKPANWQLLIINNR